MLGEFSEALALNSGDTLKAEEIIGERVRELGGDGVVELGIVVPEIDEGFPVQEEVSNYAVGEVALGLGLELSMYIIEPVNHAAVIGSIAALGAKLTKEQTIVLALSGLLIAGLWGLLGFPSDVKTKLILRGKVLRLKRR